MIADLGERMAARRASTGRRYHNGAEMTWSQLAARPDVDPQTRHVVEDAIEARKAHAQAYYRHQHYTA
jgi:hypothetical protein